MNRPKTHLSTMITWWEKDGFFNSKHYLKVLEAKGGKKVTPKTESV